MVLVLASTPKSIHTATNSSNSSNPSSPTIHRSISTTLLNTSSTRGPEFPSSLSYLHKKRHSDSSIITGAPPSTDSSNNENETIPLIRKKSGELVKSSLKLNCLANQSRSVPTTPTYKNVHFGSDVDVRYFDEKDKPTAVSPSTSPALRSMSKRWMRRRGTGATFEFADDDDCHFDGCLSKYNPGGFQNFSGYNGFTENDNSAFNNDDDGDADDGDDDNDHNDSESDNEVEVMWNYQALNFKKIKYNEKFSQKERIFLERISLDDDNEKAVIGFIAAKNLSYHKEIHVRYTYDDWKTAIEIKAIFSSESTKILKRANYDRFIFKIPLVNFKLLKQNEANIQFCLRYKYEGIEIWDNNDAKNYIISVTRTVRSRMNKKSKFSLNDYFSQSRQSNFGQTGSNFISTTNGDGVSPNYTSSSFQYSKEIDSYFHNYEGFKSPETPKALKSYPDNDPIFDDLNTYISKYETSSDDPTQPLITSDKEISSITADVAESVDGLNKLTLLTNDSNINLMDVTKGVQTLIDSPTPLPAVVKSHPLLIEEQNGSVNNSAYNVGTHSATAANTRDTFQNTVKNFDDSDKHTSNAADGSNEVLLNNSFNTNSSKTNAAHEVESKSQRNGFTNIKPTAIHTTTTTNPINPTNFANPINDENANFSRPSIPQKNGKKHFSQTKKPPMNSKYYQELIDSCCFFKGEESTAIPAFLEGSAGSAASR